MSKNRQIISKLKDFFKHNDASKAINAVSKVMESLVIQAKTIGPVNDPQVHLRSVGEIAHPAAVLLCEDAGRL